MNFETVTDGNRSLGRCRSEKFENQVNGPLSPFTKLCFRALILLSRLGQPLTLIVEKCGSDHSFFSYNGVNHPSWNPGPSSASRRLALPILLIKILLLTAANVLALGTHLRELIDFKFLRWPLEIENPSEIVSGSVFFSGIRDFRQFWILISVQNINMLLEKPIHE
jgi:hypothetical protein